MFTGTQIAYELLGPKQICTGLVFGRRGSEISEIGFRGWYIEARRLVILAFDGLYFLDPHLAVFLL